MLERCATSRRSHTSGFTLIELLIVISILGTSAVIMAPGIRAFREAQLIRSQAARVSSVLNSARARSASMNRIVRVTFSPAGLSPSDRFYVVYADTNRNLQLDAGEDQAAGLRHETTRSGYGGYELGALLDFGRPARTGIGPFGASIDADGVSFGGNQISFFPDGTTSASGTVVLVDNDDRAYAIAISVGGATRVYGLTDGGWK